MKVAAARVKLCFVPAAKYCVAVCLYSFGACARLMVKLSDTASPAVSVAVTRSVTGPVPAGSVPLKLSVAAVNFSQVGSAAPLASVAL